MINIKVSAMARYHYLIGLLEILAGGEIVGNLRWQCVKSNFFQMIRIGYLSGNRKNTFEAKHQFHG